MTNDPSPQSPNWHANEHRHFTPRISAAQESQEEAMQEVSETLLNIEQAIRRAERGVRQATKLRELEAADALKRAQSELQAVRQALFQRAYFSDDQAKLF
ncbi:hypothetical protein [Streptomyces sp. NPDC007205]|uniref:hypothetical protein n=1 Tax=Streptomyces sp. NPDC007205 TaxID=3154316 RepID=UPI0033CDF391